VSLLLRQELEAPALFFVPPLYAYFGSCRRGISEMRSPPVTEDETKLYKKADVRIEGKVVRVIKTII